MDNDNEIECPRCGEHVYADVTVCPKCGLHFYGDELDEESDTSAARAGGSLWQYAGGVVGGGLVSGTLAFAIHRLAGALWADPTATAGGPVLLWLASPLGALAGAYLAALLVKEKAPWLGLGVGVISLVPAYLLESYWRDLAAQAPGLAALSSWAVTVGAGALGGWLYQRLSGRLRVPWLEAHPESEKSLYFDLLARVRHDIDLAERLVAYESKRTPHLSRAAWIRSALERLEHDRR